MVAENNSSTKFTVFATFFNCLLFIVSVVGIFYVAFLENQDVNKSLFYITFGLLTMSFGGRFILNILSLRKG